MEVLTSFGVNFPLLIASIINFLILLYILNKIIYKPLLDVLENRRKTIEESLQNAQKIDQTLAQTEEKERHVLHQARIEAQLLIKKAEDQATKRQQEILEQAADQAKNIVAQAEKRMEQQAKQMKAEIQEGVADLVIAATKSILHDKMPSSINEDYVETTLKKIETTKA